MLQLCNNRRNTGTSSLVLIGLHVVTATRPFFMSQLVFVDTGIRYVALKILWESG